MVSVIIPMAALYLTPYFFHTHHNSFSMDTTLVPRSDGRPTPAVGLSSGADICLVCLVSTCSVGVGKLGGILAGAFVQGGGGGSFTSADRPGLRRLFGSVLLSALALLLLPCGVLLALKDYPWLCRLFGLATRESALDPAGYLGAAAALLGVFLFFLFSTLPKVGFSSLIQTCVAVEGNEAQAVFSFIGIFITVVDALMIVGLNIVFYYAGPAYFDAALMAVVTIYIAHAVFEYLRGPELIASEVDC
ncbi:putative transmembrane protein [Gregarina niphandrodes]|uniref:Transmembrane protein n=1 Tax=Gregarina niphandrodes TaxID=110365 RepID=A0A023B1S1_GRENI|nr:putative transmembrane protein [Gregarina niphandrodes]EZG47988.1 putative transmembrane protein [Gregarina niphandrodes]|eukprot:XP_011132136.1 putative transmembrane protein [Gregarina niphandrodes]